MLELLLENLPVVGCRMDKQGRILESRGSEGRMVQAQAEWPDTAIFLERVLRGETVHCEFESGMGARKRVREIWLSPNLS